MPLPHNNAKALRTLCSIKKLSEAEYIVILEARRMMLKPHISGFSLSKLGDFPFLNPLNPGIHTLEQTGYRFPETMEFSPPNTPIPDIRGIFDVRAADGKAEWTDGSGWEDCLVRVIWGLARNGDWMIARTVIDHCRMRGEVLRSFKVKYVDTEYFVKGFGIKPQHVLPVVSNAIHEWRKNRERLLRIATHIDALVTAEDCLTHFRNSEDDCYLPISVIPQE